MSAETDSSIILVGGAVVTMDTERRILDPGAIAVKGDRILAVDQPDILREQFQGAEEIDLSHTVIMPGIIDTHGHAGHGMTKGISSGGDWLDTIAKVYFHASDEEFWRAESYLSALEHIEFGVTTSLSMTGSMPRVDHPSYAVAASSGYADLGLRHIVALGPAIGEPPWHYTNPDNGADNAVDLDWAMKTTSDAIDQINGTADGRLSAFVGPSSLISTFHHSGGASDYSVAQMKAVHELAEQKYVNIHAHAYDGHLLAAASGYPDILSPKLCLAHCTGISVEECQIMADAGVNATHGPLTKAYARARFPLIEALDAGVNVVISTDGSGPDRSFDLLSQARIAAQLQQSYFQDTNLLPAGKLLEMITIDAAKALGMDDQIGSLQIGKKADIIALNLRTARMNPRMMLPQRIIYVGSGLDCDFMMVNGVELMRDREILNIDVDTILDDANRAATVSFERAGILHALEQNEHEWGNVRYPRGR